jgi:glycine/D-amino acid oxidase-like deaminating enzyme
VALLPNEASVKPRELASAVLAAAEASSATLISGAEVVSLVRDGNRCTGVKSSAGDLFSAEHVVLSAGCWSSQVPGAAPYAPTVPVRGQMIALRHTGSPIRRVLRSERGYILARGQSSPQTLVVGSTLENASYEKRVTSGGIERILSAINEIAPELANAEIIETWCGLRPGTPDQLPILGPTDVEGLVIATGHYRNGILLAPITAKLVAEWITERQTSFRWDEFSPLRFALAQPDRPIAAS